MPTSQKSALQTLSHMILAKHHKGIIIILFTQGKVGVEKDEVSWSYR